MSSTIRKAGLVIASLAAALALVPGAGAATGSGTSSTGDVDTWGLDQFVPDTSPPNCAAWVGRVCIAQYCPAIIGWRQVTLTLQDPSPVDRVALVVYDAGLGGPAFQDLLQGDAFVTNADVATYDDPVAEVWAQVGGCDWKNTAAVVGLVVDGEVAYTITY